MVPKTTITHLPSPYTSHPSSHEGTVDPSCPGVGLHNAVGSMLCGFLRAGEFTVRSQKNFDETVALTQEDVAVD